MFKTPALKLAAPLPIVVRDWKGKSVVFVSAIEEVTVLEVAATGICPAVMPESPLPGYCGMFKTPELKDAAPLVPVVVSDWKGTCVVEGVPEISENAGWD